MNCLLCGEPEHLTMTCKAALRRARKAANATGYSVERDESGRLVIVRERSQREERKHQSRMERWANRIDLDPDWR